MESLNDRLGKIINLLEDKGSWERRVDGLRLLKNVFKEDISSHGPEVAQSIANRIRLPLKGQLEDLRSQISKEACGCVVAFCSCTLSDVSLWEHCSDWFLPALLNGACVTVAVINKASSEALNEIACTGRLNRNALSLVAQGCSHKHGTYRKVAAQFLLTTIHYANDAFLLKNVGMLHKAIREGVCDAVVEVRKVARLAFWALEALHEDSAVLLYEGLDPTVQRAVDGERIAYDSWAQVQGQRVAKLSGSVDDRLKLESSQTEGSGLQMSQKSVGAESSSSFRTSGSGVAGGKKSLASSGRGMPSLSQSSKTTARAVSPGLKRPSTASSSTSSPSISLKRKSVSAAPSRHADPMAEARAQFKAAPVSSSKSASSALTADSTWATINEGLRNSEWSSRSMALVELAQFIDLGMATGDEGRIQESVVLVSRYLRDSHHKVVLTAITACGRLLATFPNQCFANIEPILAAHFGNLTSLKEPIRVAAIQQLGTIGDAYPADSLYKPILKVIDTVVTGKPKLGATEYLLHVVQNSRRIFSAPMVLTPFLLRLFKVVKAHTADTNNQQESRDTTHALLVIIAELYAINSDEFVSSIVAFPSADHRQIIRLMEGLLPQLVVDCRRVKEGHRLPPSGELQIASPFDKMLRQCTPNRIMERKQGLSLEPSRTLEPLYAEVEMSPSPGRTLLSSGRRSSKLAEEPEVARSVGTPFERSKPTNSLPYSPQDYDASAHVHTDVAARKLRSSNTSNSIAEVGSPSRIPDTAETRRAALPDRAACALASLKSDPVVLQHLSRAKTVEEKRDAILFAMDTVNNEPRLWSARLTELLPYAIASTTDSQHSLRVLGFKWMTVVFSARYLRPISVDKLEHVLRAVLMGLNDAYPEVQKEVLGLLRMVCGGGGDSAEPSFPLDAIYEALSTVLEEAAGGGNFPGAAGEKLSTPGARALLRETGQLAKGTAEPFLTSEQRSVILSRLVPLYIKAFGNSNCDVRKAVTICLVDWYLALDTEMNRFLLPFQDTQLRIVSVYYNRARTDLAGGRGHPQTVRIEDEVRSYRNQLRAEEA